MIKLTDNDFEEFINRLKNIIAKDNNSIVFYNGLILKINYGCFEVSITGFNAYNVSLKMMNGREIFNEKITKNESKRFNLISSFTSSTFYSLEQMTDRQLFDMFCFGEQEIDTDYEILDASDIHDIITKKPDGCSEVNDNPHN